MLIDGWCTLVSFLDFSLGLEISFCMQSSTWSLDLLAKAFKLRSIFPNCSWPVPSFQAHRFLANKSCPLTTYAPVRSATQQCVDKARTYEPSDFVFLSCVSSWRITRASPNGIPSFAASSGGDVSGFSGKMVFRVYALWLGYKTNAWTVWTSIGQSFSFEYSSMLMLHQWTLRLKWNMGFTFALFVLKMQSTRILRTSMISNADFVLVPSNND